MCLSCEDIARQICAMVPRWRLFGNFLRPAFPASRVHRGSDLHSKFALGPQQASKKEGRKKPQDKNKMVPIFCRAAIIINIHKEKLTKFTHAVNRVLQSAHHCSAFSDEIKTKRKQYKATCLPFCQQSIPRLESLEHRRRHQRQIQHRGQPETNGTET